MPRDEAKSSKSPTTSAKSNRRQFLDTTTATVAGAALAGVAATKAGAQEKAEALGGGSPREAPLTCL